MENHLRHGNVETYSIIQSAIRSQPTMKNTRWFSFPPSECKTELIYYWKTIPVYGHHTKREQHNWTISVKLMFSGKVNEPRRKLKVSIIRFGSRHGLYCYININVFFCPCSIPNLCEKFVCHQLKCSLRHLSYN